MILGRATAETRKERRQREVRERKAATKARLALPITPPTEPVALPWRRRGGRLTMARQAHAMGAAWSTVMSGNAEDLAGSLAAASLMLRSLGPVLMRGCR